MTISLQECGEAITFDMGSDAQIRQSIQENLMAQGTEIVR
jgi:hypothetical protein